MSGACAWPLLALLADAADGPAREELAAAIGRPADGARAAALELLAALDASAGVAAALGLWIAEGVPLRDSWRAGLPLDVLGGLRGTAEDQRALDAWCARRTDGLIDRMPVTAGAGTLLVLATALAARTRWREPFSPAGDRLVRTTGDLGAVRVVGGVTEVRVAGEGEVDVLLRRGTDVWVPAGPVRDGHALRAGDTAPGLRVSEADGAGDHLVLRVPPFAVSSAHDLTERPELFGLASALDASRGHFPHLSPQPLAVSQAAQNVRAAFNAEGFEAAAVTAVAMRAGAGLAPPGARVTRIEVDMEPPFAFVAVHRPTGVALVAGRVSGS